ncbi:MAG: membrane protein insertase YidC [Alphaproteobacteria bacterium]|nr:membrane protein insertase YidC [Alphaproteobacteria bacterium]
MTDQKNLILAIAISIAILLGFQMFVQKPHQEAARQAQQQTQPPTPAPGQSAGTASPPGTAAVPAAGAAAGAPLSRAEALARSPRVPIESARVKGSVSLRGGRVDDITLKDYRETVEAGSPQINLLSPSDTATPYFVQFGWVPGTGSADLALPKDDTVWRAEGDRLTPQSPLTLSWDNGQGLVFRRTLALDANYLLTVTDRVENRGDAPVALLPYALAKRWPTPQTAGFYILHEGLIGVTDGVLREISYSGIKDQKRSEQKTTGGWVGFTDKYWLVSLIPDQGEVVDTRFTWEARGRDDAYQADYLGATRQLAPGASAETTHRVFAGAKEVRLLDDYRDRLGIARFDRAIDFGWFYFLTKPIFYVIDYFYNWLGNFGLAILLLTVLIKLAFFPLANKSYRAMSKLKKLQPKMMELREKYGEDKQRLNQEMMQLYRKEGANPASGCLPIVIQIPVFFALYKVLFVTIEMRHAPFYGWIRDLSSPDPTTIFNLFGLIPWDPPHILLIGGWPLIMGVTMFLQQKLNPQPPDPIQAKVFMALPFVFTYMLASFPAGLVIYWAWNNTLSIIQQWVIMRRAGAA